MPIINWGVGPTDRDLELRKQQALLRELDAQTALKEQERQLKDPVEAAKLQDIARRFETRTGVGKFTPVAPNSYSNIAADQPQTDLAPPAADVAPKVVSGITKIAAPVDAALRTVPGVRRQSNTDFTDPEAAMGSRERAMNDPRVIGAGINAQADRDVANIKADTTTPAEGQSPYDQERATRNLQSVDELSKQVNGWTAGFGSVLAGVPETDARNFAAQLDTLKANIAFGELAAMRAASKTGGALGQISDKEEHLLSSTLGGLDAGQSPAQLKAQLAKVKESLRRWQQAVGGSAASPTTASGTSRRIGRFEIVDEGP